jgi:hypothetical protein
MEKRMSVELASDLAKRQGEVHQAFYKQFVGERDRLLAEAGRGHR